VLFRKFTALLIAFGPWGMLPLSFLDSVGIPVAGALDALLIFLAVKDPERAYLSAALAVVGSTIGNVFLFSVAKRGAKRFLEQSAKPGRAQRFRNWFQRYGLATIFVPALVPIPMPLKLFVFSAGALGTRMGPFLMVTVLARIVRYFGEAWLGVTWRSESTVYLKAHLWQLTAFSVGLLAALYLIIWASSRRGRVAPTSDGDKIQQ
jgi:membrane protein YqaA with SNARE-associated domain